MSENWISKKIEDIAISKNGIVRGPFGGSLKKSVFVDRGYKVYEQKNAIYSSYSIGDYYINESLFTKMERFKVQADDFIVSCSGTIGSLYRIPNDAPPGIINQALLKLRINTKKVDLGYFEHYFKWDKFQNKIIDNSQGGAIKNLVGMNIFRRIEMSCPPLPEQKKIAEILSTWDEAIETNETLISLYEKYLNSLALSLVKKRILINENVWKQTKLKDVFYNRKSYGCQSDNLKLHSLTIEDGVTAKTDRYNREFLVKGDSKKYKIAKLHDLVFNPQNLRYGAIAVNSIEHDVLLSPIYATLEIKDPTKYDIGYLGYLLTSKEMISFYDSIAEGTLVERMAVKPDVFLNQVFSIPDIATQKKIANILNTFKKKIDLLKKNKAELEKQKQGLMQRLLTGKVRVKLD